MEDLSPFFKSVIDQDTAPVVICDLAHTIIYMNPVAKEVFAEDGGGLLLGRCLFDCHKHASVEKIVKVVDWFSESPDNNIVHTMHSEKRDVYMVALRDDDGKLIGYYEKHSYRTPDDSPRYGMGGSAI